MPTVYKTAADRSKRNTRWMIAWTDEFGRRRTRRAYTDKALSERMARQLEDESRARRDGAIDTVAERMATHARAPLEDHLADYEQAMAAKGNTASHTQRTLKNIRFAAEVGAWKTVADIDDASLALSIDRLRARRRSHATINHHIRAVKGFARWLLSNHRITRDPLVGVKMLSAAVDRRRERRALDDDELAALLRVAAESPAVTVEHRYIRKAGPNKGALRRGTRTFTIERRDLLYLLAASTGLRFSEIKSLTPASFDFASNPKSVTVEAAYSKRRRRDVQPLRDDVAEAMRPLVEARPKREPLWPRLPDEIARVMAEDLKSAGVAVRDDAGRVVDFHALRHTFITRLARSGVTPKVAQALARHSTITLTMDRYAHVALADTAKALAALPAIGVSEGADGPVSRCAAATGTEDAAPAARRPLGPIATRASQGGEGANRRAFQRARLARDGAPESQRRSQRAGITSGQSAPSEGNARPGLQRARAVAASGRKSPNCEALGAPCQSLPSGGNGDRASEADGTRTRNHRIDSPVL